MKEKQFLIGKFKSMPALMTTQGGKFGQMKDMWNLQIT